MKNHAQIDLFLGPIVYRVKMFLKFSSITVNVLKRIVYLLVFAFIFASEANSHSFDHFLEQGWNVKPIELAQTDFRYTLASKIHSSGFFPGPEPLNNSNDIGSLPTEQFGLNPDFKKNPRYWLYTQIINKTKNSSWMLHISNFGYLPPTLLILSKDGKTLERFEYQNIDINTIGRAISLTLEPNQTYVLVLEIEAEYMGLTPYIALMSDENYRSWTLYMDWAFKLMLGMIICATLIALTCWVFLNDRIFLWAGLSSLSLILYYGSRSSIPAIFWQSSYEKDYTMWILTSVMLFTQIAFAASFLKVTQKDRWLYRIFSSTSFCTVALFIVGFIFPFKATAILYTVNYLILWLVILGSGIYKIFTDGRYYVIYILGWLPMVASFLELFFGLLIPEKKGLEVEASYRKIEIQAIIFLHILIHAIALILRMKSLRREKNEAERLAQEKSRFITQSNHDFRQPLGAMNIFIKYLEPHIFSNDGKILLSKLASTSSQLNESFNSIMDVCKFQTGSIKPDFQAVSVSELFSKLEDEFSIQAREKNIQLKFHFCSAYVLSDPIQLRRILKNLISNAIKFTHSGRVIVGFRQRGLIQVWDTGDGIPEEEQDTIFDIYKQSNNYSESIAGSGVGLSIVKQLSELLDHPLKIESKPGKGSCFSISTPCTPDPCSSSSDEHTNQIDVVVTLVFRSEDTCASIQEHLKKWQYPVRVFDSINEAIAKESDSISGKNHILLCENKILETLPLSFEGRAFEEHVFFSKFSVCVCIGKNTVPFPSTWVEIISNVSAIQLRAILNLAIRRDASLQPDNFQ